MLLHEHRGSKHTVGQLHYRCISTRFHLPAVPSIDWCTVQNRDPAFTWNRQNRFLPWNQKLHRPSGFSVGCTIFFPFIFFPNFRNDSCSASSHLL